MTYVYTIEANRVCRNIEESEIENEAPVLSQFAEAMDLPTGVEFADGYDADDKPVRVYRKCIDR